MAFRDTPIPFSVLTGFLGSGKTTLLNRLLQDPEIEPTLVIINEFGEIAIDHLLVDFVDPKTVVTLNGCICCVAPSDLALSLSGFLKARARGERHFERVIVETSGLADPVPTLTTIMQHQSLLGALRLDSIIVTVDAVNGADQIARFVEARRQLAIGDRVILTKQDIAGEEEIAASTEALRTCNPAASICDTRSTLADLFGASLWDPRTKRLEPARWMRAEAYEPAVGTAESLHSGRVASACLTLTEPIAWDTFNGWAEEIRERHAPSLLRLKAVLVTPDHPHPLAVHAIHNVFHPPMPLADRTAFEGTSRIVLIVQDIDPATLLDGLRQRHAGEHGRVPWPDD